jgi:Flp pilus assembly protein TadG
MKPSRPDSRRDNRHGSCIVEFALVGPIVLLLLIGMSFAGLATFRYIQLANVSRYAARWAAVHGKRYSAATDTATATADDVYQNAIKPRLVATKPEQLGWSVDWSEDGRLVTVSLTYTQSPEAYFVGGTLRSQCTMFVVN